MPRHDLAPDPLSAAPIDRQVDDPRTEGLVTTSHPLRARGAAGAAKRGIDLVGASVGLALLAPLLVLVALAVWVLDGRPVLFRQTRLGRDERPFTIVKFRTMVPDAEDRLAEVAPANERGGPLFKVSDDPRVTRLGHVLRSSCLDELPQLWNVLAGHMSLVGPRPALPDEVRQFDDELRERHRVRPGITGSWQVEARDMNCFATYRRLDLDYVRTWTVGGDLALIARTAASVIRRVGVSFVAAVGNRRAGVGSAFGDASDNVIVLLPDGGVEQCGSYLETPFDDEETRAS